MRPKWFAGSIVLLVAGLLLLGAGLVLRHRMATDLAAQVKAGHPVTATVLASDSTAGTQSYRMRVPESGGPQTLWLTRFDLTAAKLTVGGHVPVLVKAGHPTVVTTASGYTSQRNLAYTMFGLIAAGAIMAIIALINAIRLVVRTRR